MPETPTTNTPPTGGAPVTPPTPNPGATSPSGGAPVLIAGKFKDEAAFSQGFREIHKALNLPEPAADQPIFGDGKAYPNLEAATAGYKHLEGLLGRRQAQPPAPGKAPTDELSIAPAEAKTQELPADADVAAIVQRAGLKQDDLQATWFKDGKLTDDQYAAFHKIGIPKKLVDQHLTLQTQALQTMVRDATSKAETYAGGKEQLASLRAWAASNMQPDELKHLSDQVTKDPTFYPTMVQIIAARHATSVRAGNGTMVTASAPGSGAVTTKAQFNELAARAERGDKGAIETIRSMSYEQLHALA